MGTWSRGVLTLPPTTDPADQALFTLLAARSRPECRVVDAARATPPETWPNLVRRNTPEARRSAFLQLWAQLVGERESWAAALVMPREIADGVALGRALQGWRSELVRGGSHLLLTAVEFFRHKVLGLDLDQGRVEKNFLANRLRPTEPRGNLQMRRG